MYAKKKSVSMKAVALLLVVILLIGCTIGGTLAYLMATPKSVTNTFVAGKIGTLTLTETGADGNATTSRSFMVTPGVDITKDPKLTYTPATENDIGSVYIFIEVTGTGWSYNAGAGNFVTAEGMSWSVDPYWTWLEGKVFYRLVESADINTVTNKTIISDNTIEVPDTITEDTIDDAAEHAALAFTAYAIQAEGVENVEAAWTAVSKDNA